jgi:hypothetical protein
MKMKPKIELSFGDLITAAPQDWGAGRAKKMVPPGGNAPVGGMAMTIAFSDSFSQRMVRINRANVPNVG